MKDSKEIRKAIPMHPGSGNLMALSQRLRLQTGSEKFKMASAKPDILVSRFLYKIAKIFQRLLDVFGVGKVICAFKKARSRNLK